MRLLDRYIAAEVAVSTLLVVVVLLGIESFLLFFAEVGDLGKANYTADKAVWFVLMQLPFQLYQLFPMAGFLGCLIGLGRLSASSELVVMQANGVSIRRIAIAVIQTAFFLTLLVTLMGEGIAPRLQAHSERMKAIALGKEKTFANLGGIWLRNQNQFIHIGDVHSVKKAGEVSTFRLEGHKLLQTQFSHHVKKGRSGWKMRRVVQTDFGPLVLASQKIKQEALQAQFDPVVLSLGQMSIDQLSIAGLHQSITYRRRAKLDVDQYQFAFWQRLFQPLVSMMMVFLGIPFVFSAPRSISMGFRVLVGILIGFSFYMLNQFLGPLAVVYQIAPMIAALIPLLICVMICVMLFRRIEG